MAILSLSAHLKGSGDVSTRLSKTVRLLGNLSGSSAHHIKKPTPGLIVRDTQVHKTVKG